jgi:hypothetical protein
MENSRSPTSSSRCSLQFSSSAASISFASSKIFATADFAEGKSNPTTAASACIFSAPDSAEGKASASRILFEAFFLSIFSCFFISPHMAMTFSGSASFASSPNTCG